MNGQVATCIRKVYDTPSGVITRFSLGLSAVYTGGCTMPDFDYNWDGIDDRILLTANGCWHWQGAKNSRGYGYIKPLGVKANHYIHRVMYEKLVGPIPAGMQLDHFYCDNPSCCNPDHLRPVSPRENSLRSDGPAARNRAKTHCASGHPYSDENTYIGPDNRRICRICRRNHVRAFYARAKAKAAA